MISARAASAADSDWSGEGGEVKSLCAAEIRPGLAVCATVRASRLQKKKTVRGTVEHIYPKFFTVNNGRYLEGFLLVDISRGSIEVVEA